MVPASDRFARFLGDPGRLHGLKEAKRILDQVSPLVLEDRQDVLAVTSDELEKAGIGELGVPEYYVEGPRLVLQHSLKQAHGGGDFVFARNLRLGVKEKLKVRC